MKKLKTTIFSSNPFSTTSFLNRTKKLVLGIETSCDDTAVAIVDSDKNVLGRRNFSKKDSLVRLGGITPSVMGELHRNYIDRAVNESMEEAGIRFYDLDAIAVTTSPGIVLSLKVGANKAVNLSQKYGLPLIPIHHMRAHALSAGLDKHTILKYPFLTLLISGGHALLAIAHSPVDFELIGKSESGSPGECLDKIGRAIGILRLPQYKEYHTGAAIEKIASEAKKVEDYTKYQVKMPSVSGCNFNFSNIKANYLMLLQKVPIDSIDIVSMCASVQFTITSHICSRLHLALSKLSSEKSHVKQLVVSGGVASNQFIKECLSKVCKVHSIEIITPPKKLCTDNGEMIGWAGCEILNYYDTYEISCVKRQIYYDIKDYIYVKDKELIGNDNSNNWGPIESYKKILLTSLLPFSKDLKLK
uniref:N(6)-L-threonylcarbamoyladenine synthase n=1 Tax=Strongyloides venezuelensis TaxID=75913 RepID=A0A0K0EWK4_STRVS